MKELSSKLSYDTMSHTADVAAAQREAGCKELVDLQGILFIVLVRNTHRHLKTA